LIQTIVVLAQNRDYNIKKGRGMFFMTILRGVALDAMWEH
jgi:hypothetical protein